mmetsp:Transcript_12387/g.34340  ORF Transcript_12387/g.34340 Transcript_12387/m.34340 type:complete len:245 (+) Transcript_12387:2064-2798(+)
MSSAVQDLKNKINVSSPHFFKAIRFRHFFKVGQYVFLGFLPQSRSRVRICRVKDVGGCFHRNGLQHAFLTHGLETGNAKEIGRFEKLHRNAQRDLQLIRIEVLQYREKYWISHLLNVNFGHGGLLHLSKKQGLKVGASNEHELVCINLLFLHDKSNVGQCTVVDHGSKIRHQRRRRHFKVEIVDGKRKSNKIIQTITSIVSSKDIEIVIVHRSDMAKTVTRLIFPGSCDGSPPRRSDSTTLIGR